MFGKIVAVILIVGFLALSVFQVYLLIRDIKRKKKNKVKSAEEEVKDK